MKYELISWIYFYLRNILKIVNDVKIEFGVGYKDIYEDLKVILYLILKDICIDFVVDELDKIIIDLSVMNVDMIDEEYVDVMVFLLLLCDEVRYVLSDVLNDFMWI